MSSMSPATSVRFSRLPEKKLSMTRTRSPRDNSARTIDEPMKPAPPVTRHDAPGDPDDDELIAPAYSTVTLLARLRGWSTSLPLARATA